MNFYKHYLGDYSRDTADLSLAEHGAYRLMLDHYYATEKPLPADKSALYRICKAFSAGERKAVDVIAKRFFTNGDGLLRNVRADEEIEKRAHQVDVNREIGKRGGRPKLTETITERITESVSVSEPINNPHQNQNHKQQKQKLFCASGDALFDLFWSAYPKKVGKQAALKAWKALKAEKDLAERIISAVLKAKNSRRWKEGYVKDPERYLKGAHWDDAYEALPTDSADPFAGAK